MAPKGRAAAAVLLFAWTLLTLSGIRQHPTDTASRADSQHAAARRLLASEDHEAASEAPSPRPDADVVSLQTLYDRRVLLPQAKQYALAAAVLGVAPAEPYAGAWAKSVVRNQWPQTGASFGQYVNIYKAGNTDFAHNLVDLGWGETSVQEPRRRWTFVRDPVKRFVSGYSEILERFNAALVPNATLHETRCPSYVDPVDRSPFQHNRTHAAYLADVAEFKATDPLFLRHGPDTEESAQRFVEDVVRGELTKMYKLFPECLALVSHIYAMEDVTAARGLDFVGKLETFDTDLKKLAAWGGIPKTPADFVKRKGGDGKRVRYGSGAMARLLRRSPQHLHAVCALTFNDHVRFQYELPEACRSVTVSWSGWGQQEPVPVLACDGGVCSLGSRVAATYRNQYSSTQYVTWNYVTAQNFFVGRPGAAHAAP